MRVWGLLLCLVAAPQGGLSEVQLRESGPGLVRPSETLSLTCAISGESVTNNNDWSWIRQPTGKGLEYIGRIYGTTGGIYYSPSLKSRASISKDDSKNQFSLQLKSLTPEDTAIYFCAREPYYYSGGTYYNGVYGFDHWGPGIMVTVSSAPQTSPSVFPLSLGCSEKASVSAGQVVIGCLVSGFFPPPADMNWDYDGSTALKFPAMATSGNSYTMSSLLAIPADQCPDSKSLKCQVTHFGTNSFASVPCDNKGNECCISPCPACDKPRLSLHKPAIEDLLMGFDAKVTCKLSGLKNPEKAVFKWSSPSGKEAILGTPQKDDCGCYSVSSMLPGCADPWNRGATFECSATHPEITGALTATISKQKGNTYLPQVLLLPPPLEELALNEKVTLTCLVRGFNPPDLMVRWLQDNQEMQLQDYVTWAAQPEPGQGVSTYSAISTLRVSAQLWKDGHVFSCLVGHESLSENFTQKTIDHMAGKPTHVNVSVVVTDVDGNCY